MIITFEDTIQKDDWLHRCLLSSLTKEAMDSGRETKSYEVKLLVNGIELEPKVLEDLLNNVEKYIDREAAVLADRRFKEVSTKTEELQEVIEDAIEKIREKYNV